VTATFTRPLPGDFTDFVKFKRGVGYRYDRVGSILTSLERFFAAGTAGEERRRSFDDRLLDWIALRAKGRQPVSVAKDISIARQFCAYLQRRHPTRRVPEPLWPRLITASGFTPCILSASDIRAILREAAKLRWPVFRRHLFRMLVLILYCTGLRLGEALRLRMRDVDLRNDVYFIAESKGRSRWVPFHRSLAVETQRYLVVRRAFSTADPDDRFFVGVRREKSRLPISTASGVIARLLRDAGLKPPSGRGGPRTHDLRHTFAVHRLARWYRAGADPQSRLPWLSAYLGHTDVFGTETYLNATPQLLALAGRRFQRRFHLQRGLP
jgi:integrase/recombinase XerD